MADSVAQGAGEAAPLSAAKIGAKGRVLFNPSSCRACKVCEVACSIAHEGEARPFLARINITYSEFQDVDPISGAICAQCEDPPCIEACQVGAMTRDPETGAVIVVRDLCTGCMRCRRACPWDIPKLHPDLKIAIKCDLCSDRDGGPLCVEVCPLSGKALRYEPNYYIERSSR